MKKILMLLLVVLTFAFSQSKNTPADYWKRLEDNEKRVFVNGAYAMASKLKVYHKIEVNRQTNLIPGWQEPLFIERFYEIVDEHISQNISYDLSIITQHMDAVYANWDNTRIPIIEVLQIVSMAQDSQQERANLLLYKAQLKYKGR